MLSKIAMTLGGLFLMFVLALAVGLGVWAYGLNTQLGEVNAELQTLKSTHERLNSDYSDLSTGSAKTNADLATAKSEIQSLQSQLKQAQAANDSLSSRISTINAQVSILHAWWFGSEEAFNEKVKTSGDAELKRLWEKAQKTKSDEDYWNVLDYIIQAVVQVTGLTSFPDLNLALDGAVITTQGVAFHATLSA